MKSFSQIKKERNLSTKITLISLIACIVVAFVFYICLKSVKHPFATPSLFSFMLFFMLTGITFTILSAVKKDFFVYVAGVVSLVVGLAMLLAVFHVKWYITVASCVVLAIIGFLLLLVFAVDKTAFYADNDDPEYKDYKARRAEKAGEEKKEEELPELKSYK